MTLPESEQVQMALNPRVMAPLLLEVFGPEIGRPKHAASRQDEVRCYIIDTKYEPGDYCLILYQLNGHYVIGTFDWDGEEEGEAPHARQVIQPLELHAYLFPHDPALPGLNQALDPASVSAALQNALPELRPSAVSVLRCRDTVLRFRPGKRCTVRLDLDLRDRASRAVTKRTYYAKIYHREDKAWHAYQEMRMLSESAPSRDGRIVFAHSPAWLPELLMVLQEPVDGTPMDHNFTVATAAPHPTTAEGIVKAGAALAALHTAGLKAGRERPIEKELKRFRERAGKIGRVNPRLGEEMDRLAVALAQCLDCLPGWGAEITLVHGDCKPSQFLLREDGSIAILDFDHCGMADPAGDVGTFLATLEQSLVQYEYKTRVHGALPPHGDRWIPELKQQFLENYLVTSCYPVGFKHRATWYEAVALLRKAIRAFERSPYSPVPGMLITAAWQTMGRLP